MPFPPVQRVLYNRNPLDQVVCQLRFAPILRIDAAIPADFQDRVRSSFPNFSEKAELRMAMPVMEEGLPAELLRQVVQSSAVKNYEFGSYDQLWKLNLTRTFIAITTRKYERWEEFRERFAQPLEAFTGIYNPGHFVRVGLRYTNIFNRSELGLSDVPWRDLLSPAIIGLMGSEETADSVNSFESTQQIQLHEQGGATRIVGKLLETKDGGEPRFMIDSDFFDGSRIETDAVMNKLNFLNSRSTRLIRWLIKDRLHRAMEPIPI